jgi:hypothetical protein
VLRAKAPARPTDINGDGNVDGIDLTALLAAWGSCPSTGSCHADLDASGAVDGVDLTAMLADWG